MGGVSRASEKEKEEKEEETSSSSRRVLPKIVKRNAQLEKKMSEIFKILSAKRRTRRKRTDDDKKDDEKDADWIERAKERLPRVAPVILIVAGFAL